MLTRLRRAAHADAGMTLLEVTVALTVSAILAMMTSYFFVAASDTTTSTTDATVQTAQARDAMQAFTDLIRLADSPNGAGSSAGRFEQIGPDTLRFYADVGNRVATNAPTAPDKVLLSMANGTLVEQLFQADNPTADPTVTPYTYSSYPAHPAFTRLLLGCASGNPGDCITRGTVGHVAFTAYYPAAGCPAAQLNSSGLCRIDPSASPSYDHAVAVGFSFAISGIRTSSGHASETFSSLASVIGGAS